jgi:adenine phosphoribosyltransferase
MDLTQYIRDIPNFPKPGILFKDITPLLADPAAFQYAIDRMAERYRGRPVDAVAAVEARGFLFAAPLALILRKPLIPLRKPGKLPFHTHSLSYDLEYGSAELHVHTDGVVKGARVLLVDDLLATGGTMRAGCQLVEKAGGSVVACAFLVELSFLEGAAKLKPHEVFSLIRY